MVSDSDLKQTQAKMLEANLALAQAEEALREAKPVRSGVAMTRLADDIAALERDTQIVRDRLAILAADLVWRGLTRGKGQ